MKLGKALRLVLSKLDITPYRLAKDSGVGQATIGKLISGAHESASWDVVERLANGFEELDGESVKSYQKTGNLHFVPISRYPTPPSTEGKVGTAAKRSC